MQPEEVCKEQHCGFFPFSECRNVRKYIYYQNHKEVGFLEKKLFFLVNIKLGPYFCIVLTMNIAFAFYELWNTDISFYRFF